MKKFFIKLDTLEFEIFLRDTYTARQLKKNLPLTGSSNKWGKEYYFYIL